MIIYQTFFFLKTININLTQYKQYNTRYVYLKMLENVIAVEKSYVK